MTEFNETKAQEHLINLMLKSGVAWPEWANYSFYLPNSAGICVSSRRPYYSTKDYCFRPDGKYSLLLSCGMFTECATVLVDREQYEARDGWITWHGGECPVDGDVVVTVMCRDDEKELGDAELFDWSHDIGNADITAYRIHKPAQEQPPLTMEFVKETIYEEATIDELIKLWEHKQAEANQARAEVEKALKKAGWSQ